MARMVSFTAPRVAELVEFDEPALASGEVRIRTLFSGISAGTELSAYRGSNPYLHHHWDADRRLFVDGQDSSLAFPVEGWGYEEVGEIVETAPDVSAVSVGDRLWGGWGHRSTAVRDQAWAAERLLPHGLEPRSAIFAKIGAIALNAVLDADIHVGETVAVFGAGVPGQLVAQLARLNGARVVVVDGIDARRATALELGASVALDPGVDAVAERVRELTDDRGADVCIEMSGAWPALQEAIRTVAYTSRVVVGGFFQGGGEALRLGEEFHHNRIAIVGSQISGVAPALQHRWNELRKSRTVLDLIAGGRLRVDPLISHVVPPSGAPAAFEMLDQDPRSALQVVIDFGA